MSIEKARALSAAYATASPSSPHARLLAAAVESGSDAVAKAALEHVEKQPSTASAKGSAQLRKELLAEAADAPLSCFLELTVKAPSEGFQMSQAPAYAVTPRIVHALHAPEFRLLVPASKLNQTAAIQAMASWFGSSSREWMAVNPPHVIGPILVADALTRLSK